MRVSLGLSAAAAASGTGSFRLLPPGPPCRGSLRAPAMPRRAAACSPFQGRGRLGRQLERQLQELSHCASCRRGRRRRGWHGPVTGSPRARLPASGLAEMQTLELGFGLQAGAGPQFLARLRLA